MIFFCPAASSDFTFSRSALLSSPRTIRPSSAATATPSTTRSVIFSATVRPPNESNLYLNSSNHLPHTASGLNNSPSKTNNSRTPCKQACSALTPVCGSKPDRNRWDAPRPVFVRQNPNDSKQAARLHGFPQSDGYNITRDTWEAREITDGELPSPACRIVLDRPGPETAATARVFGASCEVG